MKTILLAEMKKLKWSFFLTLLAGSLYELFSILSISNNTMINYRIEMWEYGNGLFNFVFPIIAVVPFCWEFFFEIKNGYLKNIHNRCNTKKYIILKGIVTISLSGIVVFLINIIGIFIALFIISPKTITENNSLLGNYFGSFQISTPILYGFLISIWKGIICSCLCMMGYCLTLISNNIFIILTGPFIYATLEDFSLSILQIPAFSIYTSFNPNRLISSAITIPKLLFGPTIVLILSFIILIIYKKKDKKYV